RRREASDWRRGGAIGGVVADTHRHVTSTGDEGPGRVPRPHLWPRLALLLFLGFDLGFDLGDDQVASRLVLMSAALFAADDGGDSDDVICLRFDDDGAVALGGVVVAVVGDVRRPGGAERLPVQEDTGDTVVLDVIACDWREVEELHGAFDPVQAVLGDHDLIHEGRVIGVGPGVVLPHRRDVYDTNVERPVGRVDVCDLVADQRLAGRTLRAGITLVALRPR